MALEIVEKNGKLLITRISFGSYRRTVFKPYLTIAPFGLYLLPFPLRTFEIKAFALIRLSLDTLGVLVYACASQV